MIPAPVHVDAMEARLAELHPGARVSRRPSPYATSHMAEEVDVEADDAVIGLLLKHVGAGSLMPGARGTKPAPLDCAARELYALRDLLPPLGLGTPRLFAARAATAERDGWLLIERVDGIQLWQAGDLDPWEAAARWLATLHRIGAGIAAGGTPLVRWDAEYLASWPERARQVQSGGETERRARIDWLAARWPALVERLCALPATVLHGEFYPSNVIVAGARICPVDWELAAHGPGVIDLAALVSGWDDAERAGLMRAYAGAMAGGGWWRDERELGAALDDARICLCMRWLGWAEGWEAPPEHRRDWLAEALATVEERGL